MGELTNALGAAGINVAGGLASSALSAHQANKSMNWQKRMYETRYQRTVRDLRKAGLNPALMYGNLSAGSSPSGAQGQVPDLGSGSEFAAGSRAGTAKKVQGQQKDKIKNENKSMKAQRQVMLMQHMKLEAERIKIQAETNTAREVAEGQRLSNARLRSKIYGVRLEEDIDRSASGRALRVWGRVIGSSKGREVNK